MPPAPGASARKAAPPAQPLLRALAAVQQGRPAECAGLCQAILARRPNDPGALHLLGIARLCLKDSAGAVQALRQAARHDPGNGELHVNLGAALRAAGDAAAAVEALRRAVALQPGSVAAHYNLGNALAALGRHDEAATALARAITRDPSHAAAHNNLGLALQALGRSDEALAAWRRSVAAMPRQRDAHHNLGRALLASGDAATALAHLESALTAAPDDPDLHNERGVALLRLDHAEDAIAALRRALECQPDHRGARINLGSALCLAGRTAEGAAQFDEILATGPQDAGTLSNCAAALEAAGAPDRAHALLTRALALDPRHADALNNMGQVLRVQGRFAEAVPYYERALEAAPNHVAAGFGHATASLALGRFGAGWRSYLARPGMADRSGYHRAPLPASLAGTHVAVDGDQGLGDEIFFLRFLPQLADRGARVSYRPDPRLAAMLRRSGVRARIVAADAPPEAADFRVAVGDLPWLLGHDETATLPASIALTPLAERVAEMRARLADCGPGPWIGLSWRAGTRGVRRALCKEAPWRALAESLRALPGTWIALQRGPDADELRAVADAMQRPVHDLTALNDDLESMLAALSLLDDYVCVSNTNVHLRTGCGGTCRILLPHPPEFRWMASGAESPWFPGTALYRQEADGSWGAALAALRRDVATAAARAFA